MFFSTLHTVLYSLNHSSFVEYVAKEQKDTSQDASSVMERNVNTMFLTELFMGEKIHNNIILMSLFEVYCFH